MLQTILSILAAIIALGIIIMVHEFGHYIVGRMTGMKIEEFAVGMGPKIFSRTKNDIVYSIRALPIGGFTRFYGEDSDLSDDRAFGKQKLWKRVLTVAAGSVFNIVFAVILAIVTLSIFGERVDSYPTTIAEIEEGMPAAEAGLQVDDEIIAIDGTGVSDMFDIQDIIKDSSGPLVLTVLRGGETAEVTLTPKYDEELARYRVGIVFPHVIERKYLGFFGTIGRSFSYVYEILSENVKALFNLIFRFQGAENVGSVVMIVDVLSVAVVSSFEWVMLIMVAISAGIGVMNLLPFPALDGSRLVFLAIEAIRGKPVSPKVEGIIHGVGMVVLLGLFAVLAFRDFGTIFGG